MHLPLLQETRLATAQLKTPSLGFFGLLLRSLSLPFLILLHLYVRLLSLTLACIFIHCGSSPHRHAYTLTALSTQTYANNRDKQTHQEKRKTPVSFFRVFVFNVTGYFLLLCNRTRAPVFYSCYRHVLKHSTI